MTSDLQLRGRGHRGRPVPSRGAWSFADEITLRPGSSAAGGHQPAFGIEVLAGQSAGAEEPALHAAVKLADDGITGTKNPDRSGEAEPHKLRTTRSEARPRHCRSIAAPTIPATGGSRADGQFRSPCISFKR